MDKVTMVAIHHSATRTGSAEAFARYHVETHKWPGIGYHFVVEQDGEIIWCNDLIKKTYHVGNSNASAIGVCLVGDFRFDNPTDEQRYALWLLFT